MTDKSKPRKPALTGKVVRGLQLLTRNGVVVDLVNGCVDVEELAGVYSKKELDDAFCAFEWIDALAAWRGERNDHEKTREH